MLLVMNDGLIFEINYLLLAENLPVMRSRGYSQMVEVVQYFFAEPEHFDSGGER